MGYKTFIGEKTVKIFLKAMVISVEELTNVGEEKFSRGDCEECFDRIVQFVIHKTALFETEQNQT